MTLATICVLPKSCISTRFLLQLLDSNCHASLKCFSCLGGQLVTGSADLILLLDQHGVSPAPVQPVEPCIQDIFSVPQQLIYLQVHDFLNISTVP